MKSIFIFFFVCSAMYGQNCKLLKLALSQYENYPKYRIIQEPDNTHIVDYSKRFETDVEAIKDKTFLFGTEKAQQWNDETFCLDKNLESKVEFIKDFQLIKKTSDASNAQAYMTISNPVYSEDGNFSLINVNTFSNYQLGTSEGWILVFKKEKQKWKYVDKFAAFLE